MPLPEFLAIVGPTASGKTELSLRVGRALDAEIISMDSRQVYRGMDIGTGKVSLKERGLLPHHGLDLIDPDQRYSAGLFALDARRWIQEIKSRGRVPVLVGGTGFFLRALTNPMFDEPPLDRTRLERLRRHLNRLSRARLTQYLTTLDPRGDDPQREDRQRVTRAIEMALLTGRTLSWWHHAGSGSGNPLSGVVVLMDLPRDVLYARINRRVEQMVEEGLAGEVDSLLRAGFSPSDPGMTGAGYREMVEHLRGEKDLEGTTEAIRRSHRRYARRQITWFRHQLPGGSLRLGGEEPITAMTERVVRSWRTRTREARA
jgi:tRNA dimethylallyltransferase